MKAFKLDNEPKIETGFKTPEHYFENFSANLLEKLPQTETKTISLFTRNKKTFMAVAAILVIALTVPIVSKYVTKSKELDEATLETYLSYQSNLNQYDLIHELDTNDIKNLDQNIALGDDAIEDVLASNPNIEHLILE
jgi:phage regulator Rha-like protein